MAETGWHYHIVLPCCVFLLCSSYEVCDWLNVYSSKYFFVRPLVGEVRYRRVHGTAAVLFAVVYIYCTATDVRTRRRINGYL